MNWAAGLRHSPTSGSRSDTPAARPANLTPMKVKLRNPDRVVDVSGPRTVRDLLNELGIVPEAVLVIREATLLTRDEDLSDTDEVEVRPVLSGGSR